MGTGLHRQCLRINNRTYCLKYKPPKWRHLPTIPTRGRERQVKMGLQVTASLEDGEILYIEDDESRTRFPNHLDLPTVSADGPATWKMPDDLFSWWESMKDIVLTKKQVVNTPVHAQYNTPCFARSGRQNKPPSTRAFICAFSCSRTTSDTPVGRGFPRYYEE